MTDLQTSLMLIGGAIVVAVISYNKWQEYKTKKSVEQAFASDHEDVLMTPEAPFAKKTSFAKEPPSMQRMQMNAQMSTQAQLTEQMKARQEPTLEGELSDELSLDIPATLEEALRDQPAQTEPAQAQTEVQAKVQTLKETPPAPHLAQKDLPVDDIVDYLIPIVIEAPVRGDKVLPRLHSLNHVGNKPVHFIGQRDDGMWEPVMHGGIYYGLQAGVQLSNRSSALNEIEYSELITGLREIADEIDAEPEVPDMAEVMKAARVLHQFVHEYDAQLSVNIQSTGAPWAINTLLGALERQGFDLRPDGKLVMPDGDGGILFSLSTNVTLAEETTSRLTLLLDVPRVAPSRDGFNAMAACARVLAGRLGGTVVDDGGQPLREAALEEIAQQVGSFYSHMEDAGIPAGSSRALRLFS